MVHVLAGVLVHVLAEVLVHVLAEVLHGRPVPVLAVQAEKKQI